MLFKKGEKAPNWNGFKKGNKTKSQFKKGHRTWLKGTKGLMKPNSGSFEKGCMPWNKNKKGLMPTPWNKGLKGLDSTPGSFKKGSNHPCWQGGITPLNDQIRSLLEAKQWKKQVFERDNYTCQECGDKTSGNLVAHHKNGFAKLMQEFLKEYDQFSPIEDKETLVRLAITYKPFWDLDNGITSCEDCHELTKNYGRI